MNASIYNQTGKEAGKITLPEGVFDLPWNSDLVHQVVVSMQANMRTPVAHAKDRSEVSGGGKKPWRQKGTGRARHGSSRSPIWIGGGVTHGPTNEKNYKKKINKKMKAKALYTVLSRKLKDGEVLFVDKIETGEIKTKNAKEILSSFGKISGFENIAKKKKNALYITTTADDKNTNRSFSNFSNIALGKVENLNLLNILNHKYLIITEPEKSVETIGKKIVKAA